MAIVTQNMKIIDSHLHLFDLTRGNYQWLQPSNPPHWPDKDKIFRSFSESDLALESGSQLASFVHIEAGFDNHQPWREIAWLEQRCQLPFRAIAYLDLAFPLPEFRAQLNKLKGYHSVHGVRDIFDERAASILVISDIVEKFKLLEQAALSFELQMSFEQRLEVTTFVELLALCPKLQIQINHAGFPPIAERDSLLASSWYQGLKRISQLPNTFVKCSGWEIADRTYDIQWPIEVIDLCLALFGENRVLLASNFPLTLFSKSYPEYWQQLLTELSRRYPQTLVTKLAYKNSQQCYSIPSADAHPERTNR